MRIRTIKPEFFLHEGLFEAEKQTGLPLRVAYAGLWCAADREGRFKWEPRRLGVQILPYDMTDFSRVLDALTTRGFIVRYASTTGEIGLIPSFTTHQVINNRERESELPAPPESLDLSGLDACGTRAARDDDGNAELKSGREGKGKEGNKEIPAASPAGDDEKKQNPDPRHSAFIKAYAEAYEVEAGTKYVFQGRDAKTLQRFLQSTPVTVQDMMQVVRWAWARSKEPFASKRHSAATIHDFLTDWQALVMDRRQQSAAPKKPKYVSCT